MVTKTRKPNRTIQAWIDARQRHHLSHAQVQMARELGMNPAKLGKLDSHAQNRATPTRCGWPTRPEAGAKVRRGSSP